MVQLAGDQVDDVLCAFAEFPMFVGHKGYEGDVAGSGDVAVSLLFEEFFGSDGKISVFVDITVG